MPATNPEELRARIGERIRGLAKLRRLTFTDIAREAGVSRAHLYGIVNGRTSATSDTLAKIATALGVDPVALVRPYRKPRGE